MTYTATITESQIMQALGEALQELFPPEITIVVATDNRVPMPKTNFVAIRPLGSDALIRPISRAVDLTSEIAAPKVAKFSLDFIGTHARNLCEFIASMWNTAEWVDIVKSKNPILSPMYSDNPQSLPLSNAEKQTELRWHFEVTLQINVEYTIAAETATTLQLDVTEAQAGATFIVEA